MNLVNFALYQVGWFALVIGAGQGYPWWGVAIGLVFSLVHLALAKDRRTQMGLMLIAALTGLVLDTTLLNLGIYEFSQGVLVSWLPPLWMTVLWLQFATIFRYPLGWLSGRYGLCALFGLVGAPLAFYGGEKLQAISFPEPRTMHFVMLGIGWAIVIPFLFFMTDRLSRALGEEPGYRGLSS